MELRSKNEAEIMEEECLLACSPWFSKPALLCKPSYLSFNQSTVHRAREVRYRIRDTGHIELLGKRNGVDSYGLMSRGAWNRKLKWREKRGGSEYRYEQLRLRTIK